ncbi:MAG: septum formation initiator family protein [Candidatus Brocadiia bacterium]
MRVFSTRSFWLPLLFATLVAAFFGALLARRGRVLNELAQREADLRARVAELERQNEQLRAQRDALLNSPEAIERAAREEYGFTAPGEQVTEFDPPPRRGTRSTAEPEGPPKWARVFAWHGFPFAVPACVFVLSAVVLTIWNLVSRQAGRN